MYSSKNMTVEGNYVGNSFLRQDDTNTVLFGSKATVGVVPYF